MNAERHTPQTTVQTVTVLARSIVRHVVRERLLRIPPRHIVAANDNNGETGR